ncbi:DUF6252 family protein [Flavobacterium difficile]|uniref:Lipoprotein n=1 Tax=Flavobacterium difficile TaxID=2709659 RepID=A0ABX0I302_9FLAO|nr:DUF6252 family protein [Flavobacterium difficile]NHM01568.1 hypothetical protein [Flavobacterium difficile]
MKKILILLALTLTLSCCNKDDNPSSSNDQLPPETQTGANTVGCLVNGKVFLPHQEGINPAVNCFYQLYNGEYFFTMNFADLRGTGVKAVVIQTSRINLEEGQIYLLNKNIIEDGDFSGGGQYYISSILSNNFYTNTIKTGELKITRLDISNSIISGTFWFDAVNTAGETVEIRSGRFDWNY